MVDNKTSPTFSRPFHSHRASSVCVREHHHHHHYTRLDNQHTARRTCSREDAEVALEGDHAVARVGRDEALEGRDGARRRRLREEAEDAEHREAAVVDLDLAAASLLLLRVILEEAKRVVEVEDELGALPRDRGEVPREAARRVVRVEDLTVRLEHADEREDLELADERDGVPLLGRREARRVALEGEELVGARDEVGRLDEVAEEARHRDAAVLDLGVAQVADRALVAEAPEVEVEAAEGVPEADDRVELRGELGEVLLRLLHRDHTAADRGVRDERRRGAEAQSEGEGGLGHG
mmetsp:Transcript_27286/g.109285  ORF Transcript_27286/g.109285 Transcript_27286/m.109285 type:complete len:295 (+) Transcript_27286:163-1047(+)